MSNTSIGDVELSERTYPFIVRQYSFREGSGGNGRHKGGEGCIRAIEFARDVDCAILSDRRTNPPYGMNGGEPGARGKNIWIRKRDGVTAKINLGGRNQMRCMAGDMVVISEFTVCNGITARARADKQTRQVVEALASPEAKMTARGCSTSRTSRTSLRCGLRELSRSSVRLSSHNDWAWSRDGSRCNML